MQRFSIFVGYFFLLMKWNIPNTSYRSHVYRSIIAFIVGLIILFMPNDTLNTIVVMIGCFVLLAGLGSAVAAYRATTSFFSGLTGTSSVVSIVLGVLCIARPWFFVDIMIFFIGIIISIVGLMQIVSVRHIRRRFKRSAFYYPGSIITLLAGLFLVFFPQQGIQIIGVVIGGILVIYALNEAGISLSLHHMEKEEDPIEDALFEELD